MGSYRQPKLVHCLVHEAAHKATLLVGATNYPDLGGARCQIPCHRAPWQGMLTQITNHRAPWL